MFLQLKEGLILVLFAMTLSSGASLAQSQSATFRSIDDREVKLSDLRGKVVVMSFGGTWVPMAARECRFSEARRSIPPAASVILGKHQQRKARSAKLRFRR